MSEPMPKERLAEIKAALPRWERIRETSPGVRLVLDELIAEVERLREENEELSARFDRLALRARDLIPRCDLSDVTAYLRAIATGDIWKRNLNQEERKRK